MKTIKFLLLPALISLLFITVSATTDGSRETERIHSSINVLKDFAQMEETIPHDLIKECQGVVIIPNLLNAGFVAGGKRGRGIALVKLDDGSWRAPAVCSRTAGRLGLQVGG